MGTIAKVWIAIIMVAGLATGCEPPEQQDEQQHEQQEQRDNINPGGQEHRNYPEERAE